MVDQGQKKILEGNVRQPVLKLTKRKKTIEALKKLMQVKRRNCVTINVFGAVGESNILPPSISLLLQQFSNVLSTPTSLLLVRPQDHSIPLKHEAQPFKMKPYRYSHSQKIEIEAQVSDMVTSGVIQPNTIPFSSLVILVKKKDNTCRFYVDYRHLNDITIKDRYLIPNIEELIDELFGSQVYSKINLRSSYHQIRVKPADTHKTAFQIHPRQLRILSNALWVY